jgi:Mrp family chromosome partitioning ATPase
MASAASPENANEGCVGPSSDSAGTASACAGCPNQAACASGAGREEDDGPAAVAARLKGVKHIILVLSGKGGVGKSTVACQLAFALASRGADVGLLDVDICGPSVPRMLGLEGQEVHQSAAGWSPVYVHDNLGVMSIGFMLPGSDDAVIWRGPRKNGLIRQFLSDVDWGSLDYLIIDTPPGTSDEHISTVQFLKKVAVAGAVVVTTPQEVAMADVRKELNFCRKTGIKVLGVVGNMCGLQVPMSSLQFAGAAGEDRTEEVQQMILERLPELASILAKVDVFDASARGAEMMAARFGVPYLGGVPMDPNLTRSCEEGKPFLEAFRASPAAEQFSSIVEAILRQTTSGDAHGKATP